MSSRRRWHVPLLVLGTLLASCSSPGVIGGDPIGGGGGGGGETEVPGGSGGGPAGDGGGAGGGASGCAPSASAFEQGVWSRVLANRCATCHGAGGVAKGTRLVFVAASAPDAMATNLTAAAGMALETKDGQSLLLSKPSGTDHVGGLVVSTESAEYSALADFAGRVRGAPGACEAQACTAGQPGPRLLRRLTRVELDNTLRELFGTTTRYAASLVPDTTVNGFDNSARGLTVTPLLADQLRKVAEEVAVAAAKRPELACATDGPTCARTYLEGGAARVFRRPLTAAEVTRWAAVYQLGRDTAPSGTAAHQSGMELLLSGLLQSPAFLYRAELGVDDGAGGYTLTSYEIASELSYFLWASPPDDELWSLATTDGLRDLTAIEAQARRLIASPRARAGIDRFTAQWLTVDQLAVLPKDLTLYPELTPALRAAMSEELFRRVAAVVQTGGTLSALLTGHSTWVNAGLAQLYGIAPPASPDATGFGEVQAGTGLLGTGAVLTAHARPNGSSPISRGKLVREQLLCQSLPTPPSGVVAQPPAPDPALTTRQRYTQHSADPACNSCHLLVDPLGWGFEHYDGIGRYRATEAGQAIDDTGEILATTATNGPFAGLDALSSRLAASSEVASCFALEWTRFAYGLRENTQTACLTDEIRQRFATGTGALDELLVSLTQTRQFRFRVADGTRAVDDPPDAGPGPGTPDAGPVTPPDAGTIDASDAGTVTPPDAGLPDAGVEDPKLTPEVTTVVTTTNQWQTGYCSTVTVTNPSSHPVVWRVRVTIDGTIYDHWNFTIVSRAGTSYVISGDGFNASVPAGGTAEGGFCANR